MDSMNPQVRDGSSPTRMSGLGHYPGQSRRRGGGLPSRAQHRSWKEGEGSLQEQTRCHWNFNPRLRNARRAQPTNAPRAQRVSMVVQRLFLLHLPRSLQIPLNPDEVVHLVLVKCNRVNWQARQSQVLGPQKVRHRGSTLQSHSRSR